MLESSHLCTIVLSTMHGGWHSPTYQALAAAAPGHQPLAEALPTDRVTPAAINHRATRVTLAPCMESQQFPAMLSHMPDPSRCQPGTYSGSLVGCQR